MYFSRGRFNHLVWGWVRISGSHIGSLGEEGYGPNRMPRHVLMNLDPFLKTLSYLPSLCTLEELVRQLASLPDGSKGQRELHPGRPYLGFSLLWLVVLEPLPLTSYSILRLSSHYPSAGSVFSLFFSFPIYMKDFLKKVFMYLFIWLVRSQLWQVGIFIVTR